LHSGSAAATATNISGSLLCFLFLVNRRARKSNLALVANANTFIVLELRREGIARHRWRPWSGGDAAATQRSKVARTQHAALHFQPSDAQRKRRTIKRGLVCPKPTNRRHKFIAFFLIFGDVRHV